ncbi:MAG: response regulator [Bacteroidales bacterium]|nr:response regulator [Bacteroidales bacterium]
MNQKQEEYTILIVEDNDDCFLYLEKLLEDFELKLNILHVANGQEAVEICRNNSDIKLVLMNLGMPIMDGYEATKKIRKFRSDLPIIAQTAYSSPEAKNEAKQAGCNDFILKPIQESDLFSVLNKLFIF